jgi:hypothetical protein
VSGCLTSKDNGLVESACGESLLLVDESHGLLRTSEGFSRLGAYLALRLPAVMDDDSDVVTRPARWANFAWGTATRPVMSRAYIKCGDDIEVVSQPAQ